MKLCVECLEKKPETEFYRQKSARAGHRRVICKVCCNQKHKDYVERNKDILNARRRAAYQANKGPAIAFNLKRFYGLSLADYDKLFKAQDGRCKICSDHQDTLERRLDVDHNHRSGKVRGLLCIRCNRGIGLLKDDVKVLQAAIRYLQEE